MNPNQRKAMFAKNCPKCGTHQPIVPTDTFSSVDGKHHTLGYCYDKGHLVTKNPYAKRYETFEDEE